MRLSRTELCFSKQQEARVKDESPGRNNQKLLSTVKDPLNYESLVTDPSFCVSRLTIKEMPQIPAHSRKLAPLKKAEAFRNRNSSLTDSTRSFLEK